MNTKLSQTLSVLMLVFYAACILIFKTGGVLWFVYFALLGGAFFLEKRNIELPICLVGALPVAEFIWIGIYSNWFDQTRFLNNLSTTSTFFDYGGFPGYVMWILVIPIAIYKLSHIWGKG